jgi:hypothetical protein
MSWREVLNHASVVAAAAADVSSDVFFATASYAFYDVGLQYAVVAFTVAPIFGYVWWLRDQKLLQLLSIDDATTSYLWFVPVVVVGARSLGEAMLTWVRTQLDISHDRSPFHHFFGTGTLPMLVVSIIASAVWVVFAVAFGLAWILVVAVPMLGAFLLWVLFSILYHLLGLLAFLTKVVVIPSFVEWWIRGIHPQRGALTPKDVNRFANMVTIAELGLETLGQMVVVIVNNTLTRSWTPVSIASFVCSSWFFASLTYWYFRNTKCGSETPLDLPLLIPATAGPPSTAAAGTPPTANTPTAKSGTPPAVPQAV